ncbi:fimbrial protein [Burkholderia cepacia]|uniref:Type-1 fimbrial protein, A subunit n=1 Tax=Burkholderia cepacia GG4 TaxID=1009846 RepID=A0A9W3JVW7_BURCE|nr:fimbrial protein [Burkholderia cepacia]AFQ46484.1 type-1 fimbrial protein, A subunit [Burkholderia cepacia GG4]
MNWSNLEATPRQLAGPRPHVAAGIWRAAGCALLLWSVGIGNAFALKCTATSLTRLGELPKVFKVSSDVPINTVLWRKTGIKITADCGLADILDPPVEAMVMRPSLYIGNGLSLMLTYNGNRGSTEAAMPTGVMVNLYYPIKTTPVTAIVDVELVKTGPTPSTHEPFPFTAFATALIGNPRKKASAAPFFTYGADNISFQATTCDATNKAISVPLGPHTLNAFAGLGSGVGSTSAAKDFTIGLKCDSGIAGEFVVNLMLDGSVAVPDAGVLALSSSSDALGIGVQVLKGRAENNQPVRFGTPWQVADTPATSTVVNVPLSARYYQTAAKARPGSAAATATFTIIYR